MPFIRKKEKKRLHNKRGHKKNKNSIGSLLRYGPREAVAIPAYKREKIKQKAALQDDPRWLKLLRQVKHYILLSARYFDVAYQKIPIEVWALVVLAFGIGLRLLFPYGLGYWDDFDYARIAKTIEEGRYQIDNYTNWFGHRLPVIFPVAGFMKLFGYEEWVLMAWPFFSSVMAMVFIFYIGTLLYSKRAGFWALVFLAIHPMEAKLATILLPSSIFSFILLGGMFFFLLGERLRPARTWLPLRFFLPGIPVEPKPLNKKPLWLLAILHLAWLSFWAISAAFILSTFYLRPYGMLFLLLPAVYMLVRYGIRWEYIWLPLFGVIILYFFESYLHSVTGEWFFTYNFIKRAMTPDMYPVQNVTEHLDFYREMIFEDKRYNIYTILGIALFPVFMSGYKTLPRKTKAALLMPVLYILVFWGYLEFGVFSIEHWSFLFKEDRYLALINPPIAMIIGQVVAKRTGRYGTVLTAIFLIFVAWYWFDNAGAPPLWESFFDNKNTGQ